MSDTKNLKLTLKKILMLGIFAIAMAMVEAAVVIYLRELYYPSGFFIQSVADLAMIPEFVLKVELWREASTIIMLFAVGVLAFPQIRKKFWAFVFTFSMWDLFYYLFLYIFLRWPPSLDTIDVYFLIPWPWIGPVWFPLTLFSISLIISFWKLLKFSVNKYNAKI